MPSPYEELLDGETFIRSAPNAPHEVLCDRLHAAVTAHLPANSTLRLLARRTLVDLRAGSQVCPDLALVRSSDGALYLAAEVLQPGDHHPDTVIKKQIYQDARAPRLWVVDSRYQNVEVYGTGEFGFRLVSILANAETLADATLPGLAVPMRDLFANLVKTS